MSCLTSQHSFLLVVVFIIISNSLIYRVQGDTEEYLDNLGRSLKKRLSNPGKETDHLLRDLFDYYNHLKELHQNITSGNEVLGKEAMDTVQLIIESGGPQHLNIEIDFDEFLFKVYKNDRDVQAINNILKDTREIWTKLKTLYEKHAQI